MGNLRYTKICYETTLLVMTVRSMLDCLGMFTDLDGVAAKKQMVG